MANKIRVKLILELRSADMSRNPVFVKLGTLFYNYPLGSLFTATPM